MIESRGFSKEDGIFVPQRRLVHRNEEYEEAGFEVLLRMQREHFWYVGRHRILLRALRAEIEKRWTGKAGLRAIDMGGGCGGWLAFLHESGIEAFDNLALADSSIEALKMAAPVVGKFADRYQIDLLDLGWSEEWDAVFLLDVLEHIPDHAKALVEIRKSLRPGGMLFLTVPALNSFWTYSDDISKHQRRYCKRDIDSLAQFAGFDVARTEYFMFFLSPALLLSRLLHRPPSSATAEDLKEFVAGTHRVPPRPLNSLLSSILSLEAALIDRISFPWGTSLLAVLRR
ncbi:MAG TPA: class I SAM-dependent methyltransferase [Rhodocyclaceae bacterium]